MALKYQQLDNRGVLVYNLLDMRGVWEKHIQVEFQFLGQAFGLAWDMARELLFLLRGRGMRYMLDKLQPYKLVLKLALGREIDLRL